MYFCFNCRSEVTISFPVEREDVCSVCNAYLRVCLNCQFYDHFSHSECKEPAAEPPLKKDVFTVCEYFKFKSSSREEIDKREKALKEWESLFKKI